MITAKDGPAAGKTFACRRAPVYLRIVRAAPLELVPSPDAGWDVLDQLDDTPSADEEVFVYRIIDGTWSCAYLCRAGADSGRYELGQYRLVEPQPDEATLRDTALWRAWASAQG